MLKVATAPDVGALLLPCRWDRWDEHAALWEANWQWETEDMKPIQVGALVVFAVSAFLVAVGLGTAINIAFGVPLLGGIVNGVLTAGILTIGLLTVPRWFAATTMWFVFSCLCVPTATLGPPGLYKIPIGLVAGLLWDAVYQAARRRLAGLLIGALLGAVSIIGSMLILLRLVAGEGMTEVYQRYVTFIWAILGINALATTLGVLLGSWLFQRRLCRLAAFQNILGHENGG